MKTIKNKNKNKNNQHNFTRKKSHKHKPMTKILPIGSSLFAAKYGNGKDLLEIRAKASKKEKSLCILDNACWFGDYDVARIYKTSTNNIFEWKVKRETKLLEIDPMNEKFLDYIFNNSKIKLTPCIQLSKEDVKKIKSYEYKFPYIYMRDNEKAYYEFKFAFGYLTLVEQYNFLKFVDFLIIHKIIDIETRDGKSILTKIRQKMIYYNTNIFFRRKEKYNRLSIYLFDKYAILNLCRLVGKQLNISGVFQKNDTSFWFPDFVVYKMNIEEYILFNPQNDLSFHKKLDV